MTTEDWQALAKAVVDRRVQMGFRYATQFAREQGFGLRTLNDIENARRASYDRATLVSLEQALDWMPGSAMRVLQGEGPLPLAWAPTPEPPLDNPASPDAPIDTVGLSTMQAARLRDLAGAMREAESGPEYLRYVNINTEILWKNSLKGGAGRLDPDAIGKDETDMSDPSARLRRVARAGKPETEDPGGP